MKYVVILGDGMADYPLPALNGKTPLQVANKPYIDRLAKNAEIGFLRTVPDSMKPGSDVANLSVLGYDPLSCYTGRSPLEAASIGIDLCSTDVTARANLVTVSDEENYQDKTMIDYSAGEISTEEAKELIDYLAEQINTDEYKLFAGISYRHCLVIKNGKVSGDLTPPHDITGRKVKGHLPQSQLGKKYLDLMEKSFKLLKDHPINLKRIASGKNPANSLWFWGEGTKPNLENFENRFSLKGGIISAVDLLKGIGKLAGMRVFDVPFANGNYDTNYEGKAKACLDGLKDGLDYVYLHLEGPDECGHHGDLQKKIYAIEQIDGRIVKPVVEGLKGLGEDYTILICPDHPTPIELKTHVSDPVPYLLYRSDKKVESGVDCYNEESAKSTGIYVENGYSLAKKMLGK